MVKVKDRIEVVDTTSKELKPGNRGTVLGFTHLPTGQYMVHVHWDNGKTARLIEGDDVFKVIASAT